MSLDMTNTVETDVETELQEEFENPTSYEQMIGRAIMGDDADKDTQMRRVDCKMYASQKIFCECGDVHDQKKIQILRNHEGAIQGVVCRKCRTRAEETILLAPDSTGLRGWTWDNWFGTELVCAIFGTDAVAAQQAAKDAAKQRPKPEPKPRAKSIRACLNMGYRTDVVRSLYAATGLLIVKGMCIIHCERPKQPLEGIELSDVAARHKKQCLEMLGQVPGESVTVESVEPSPEHEAIAHMIGGHAPDVVKCDVSAVMVKTAEKHGKVKSWRYGADFSCPSIVGFAKNGRPVAIIACIVTD